MKPLSLTDQQYKLVHAAAKLVPVEWRSRFLEAIADRLLDLNVLTDADVSAAVHHVLSHMFGRKVEA